MSRSKSPSSTRRHQLRICNNRHQRSIIQWRQGKRMCHSPKLAFQTACGICPGPCISECLSNGLRFVHVTGTKQVAAAFMCSFAAAPYVRHSNTQVLSSPASQHRLCRITEQSLAHSNGGCHHAGLHRLGVSRDARAACEALKLGTRGMQDSVSQECLSLPNQQNPIVIRLWCKPIGGPSAISRIRPILGAPAGVMVSQLR